MGVGMRAVDTWEAAVCQEPEVAGDAWASGLAVVGKAQRTQRALRCEVTGWSQTPRPPPLPARPTCCAREQWRSSPAPRRYANAVATAGVIL